MSSMGVSGVARGMGAVLLTLKVLGHHVHDLCDILMVSQGIQVVDQQGVRRLLLPGLPDYGVEVIIYVGRGEALYRS